MEDMRPEGVIGQEHAVVHDNLVMLQEQLGYSNQQMAEILDVEKKYYERIKKNGGPLDYRKREAIKLFGILIWKYALRTENEYLVGKMK